MPNLMLALDDPLENFNHSGRPRRILNPGARYLKVQQRPG